MPRSLDTPSLASSEECLPGNFKFNRVDSDDKTDRTCYPVPLGRHFTGEDQAYVKGATSEDLLMLRWVKQRDVKTRTWTSAYFIHARPWVQSPQPPPHMKVHIGHAAISTPPGGNNPLGLGQSLHISRFPCNLLFIY